MPTASSKPTTGKVTTKRYRCAHCSAEHDVATNHYGEVYSRCPNSSCLSRRPSCNSTYQPPRHVCLDELPQGMGRPEPWKVVKLGDVLEIV